MAPKPVDDSTSEASPFLLRLGIAGIFNGVYTFLVALLLAGLVKPKWILRWDAKANRKKLVGYFFVVAVPFGISGKVTKSSTTRAYDARIRADKAAERAAEAAKQKAMEEEQSARRAAQAESVQASRREISRPRALRERYYAAINASGTMCEQYRFVIKNWHESGFDENVLNRQAAGVFAQARESGCVQ